MAGSSVTVWDLNFEFSDLLGEGHTAFTTTFLIDGHALTRVLIEADECAVDNSRGGQFLHSVFQVERFLANLRNRHATFKVAFLAASLGPAPSVLRTTQLVVEKHLTAALPADDVGSFASFLDQEFALFAHNAHPIFFAGRIAAGESEHDALGLLCWFLDRQAHFADLATFVFNDVRIQGQVARRALIEAEGTLVGDDFALTSDQSGDGGDAGAVRAALADLSLAAGIQAEAGLRGAESDAFLGRLLFIFGAVSAAVPARARAQPLAFVWTAGAANVSPFVTDTFVGLAGSVLQAAPAPEAVDDNLCDIFDGRLFEAACFTAGSAPSGTALDAAWFGVADDVAAALSDRWTAAGGAGALFPLIAPAWLTEAAGAATVPDAAPDAPNANPLVFPINAEFVGEVLGQLEDTAGVEQMPALPETHPEVVAVENRIAGFLRRYRWFSERPLDEDLVFPVSKRYHPQHLERQKNPKWVNKLRQLYSSFIERYSQSVEGNLARFQTSFTAPETLSSRVTGNKKLLAKLEKRRKREAKKLKKAAKRGAHAEEIARANLVEKRATLHSDLSDQWRNIRQEMGTSSPQEKIRRSTKFDDDLQMERFIFWDLRLATNIYLKDVLLNEIDNGNGTDETAISLVSIAHTIATIADRAAVDEIDVQEARDAAADIMDQLGFDDAEDAFRAGRVAFGSAYTDKATDAEGEAAADAPAASSKAKGKGKAAGKGKGKAKAAAKKAKKKESSSSSSSSYSSYYSYSSSGSDGGKGKSHEAAVADLTGGATHLRFQMEKMGKYFARADQAARDGDEEGEFDFGIDVGFRPDAWQRRLIRIVDNRDSALVVAPTSSGKTFISYYAMESIMRESQDHVVVYVAPTKSLCNQISAEVYARFKGVNYTKSANSSAFGVFTRDYRTNALTSQVLVTVPACLEMLLLSPSEQCRKWRRRVKYVIIDEVHSLASWDNGPITERILHLIDAPFIALSATIGNPAVIHSWLSELEATRGRQLQARIDAGLIHADEWRYDEGQRTFDVHLVEHKERWSDLKYYMYVPREDRRSAASGTGTFGGTYGQLRTEAEKAETAEAAIAAAEERGSKGPFDQTLFGDLEVIHPAWALTSSTSDVYTKRVAAEGFPSTLIFTPEDSLALFAALKKNAPNEALAAAVEEIAPENVFKSGTVLTRADARRYEALLKDALQAWCTGGHVDAVEAVIQDVAGRVGRIDAAGENNGASSGRISHEHVHELVMDLAAADRLPGILFSLDRHLCDELAESLMLFLEDEHEKYMSQNPALVAEGKRLEALLVKARDANEDAMRRYSSAKNRNRRVALETLAAREADLAAFKATHRSPFTFVKEGHGEEELVEECFKGLEKKQGWKREEHPLLRALVRGIGVHHAQLPLKYRQTVEQLFRAGYLQVCFATGTLALGIHMPCKTSGFVGDSHFLDTMQFRQMSGRCGRRGYDLLGHVVVYGIPAWKVKRLIMSPLPAIRGQFPLPTSFVLKLFQLYHQDNDKLEDVTAGEGSSSAAAGADGEDAEEEEGTSEEHRAEQVRAVDVLIRIFEHPLAAAAGGVNGEASKLQLRHQFKFAVDFLFANGLIDRQGVPRGLAALTSHLFVTEPSNFAMAALFPYFAEVAERNDESRDDRFEATVLALARVFEKIPVHPLTSAAVRRARDEEGANMAGLVVIPPAEDSFNERIGGFEGGTNALLRRYVESYSKAVIASEGANPGLPFSDAAPFGRAATNPAAGLVTGLETNAIDVEVRSPYAAISGRGDATFMSLGEVMQTIRDGVVLDPSVAPLTDLTGGLSDTGEYNAYVADFFHHGSKSRLATENNVEQSLAWANLTSIKNAIARFGNDLERIVYEPHVELEDGGAGVVRREAKSIVNLFVDLEEVMYEKISNFNHDRLAGTGVANGGDRS